MAVFLNVLELMAMFLNVLELMVAVFLNVLDIYIGTHLILYLPLCGFIYPSVVVGPQSVHELP